MLESLLKHVFISLYSNYQLMYYCINIDQVSSLQDTSPYNLLHITHHCPAAYLRYVCHCPCLSLPNSRHCSADVGTACSPSAPALTPAPPSAPGREAGS